MKTNKLASRSLCLMGTLLLVFSSSLQAVQNVYHTISFSTTDDKMWGDSGTGVSDSFSYAIIDEDIPDKTLGDIETWNIDNPLWDAWKASLDACTLLGWTEKQCKEGVEVPNPAYIAWKELYDECREHYTASQCKNGGQVPTLTWLAWDACMDICLALPLTTKEWCEDNTCGDEPTHYKTISGLGEPPPETTTELVALPPEPAKTIPVKNGAEVKFTNTYLLGGFEGSYSLGNGSVNASYLANAHITVPSLINAGDLVTIGTNKLASDTPTLATDLSGVEMDLSAFMRSSAKADFKAVALGETLIDETMLDYDTGVLHQEVAYFRVGGDEENLELRILGADVFEFVFPGANVNIPLPFKVLPPPYDSILNFPIADVGIYLPDLRTPPHTRSDPIIDDRVINGQLPVERAGICTLQSCPDATRVDFGKVDLDLDVATVVAGMGSSGVPIPLGATSGITGVAGVEINVLDSDIGNFFGIAQDLDLTVNNIRVKFSFSQPVEVETSPGVFLLTSEHTVDIGTDLVFEHPGGPLEVTPLYLLTDNSFHNKTFLIRQPEMTTNYLQVKATGALFAGLGGGTGVPTDWSVLNARMPLTAEPIPIHTIFEDTYPLQGFNTVSAPSINLDPNDAPTIDLQGVDMADEGQVKTYLFSVVDTDAGDTFTVANGYPDCGTGGEMVNGSLAVDASGGSFQCAFPDGPASPEVRVQVEDDRGAASDVASLTVTVNNVQPSMSLGSPARSLVVPGTPLRQIVFSASDVPADPLTVTLSWKKDDGPFTAGLPDEGTVPSGLSLAAGSIPGMWIISGPADLVLSHIYTIRITLDDGDGGTVYKDVVITTVAFLAPVPGPGRYALLVLALLVLGVGLVGVRRHT